MNKYQVRITNKAKGKSTVTTVIEKNDKDAIAEALTHLRKPDGYVAEIISTKKAKPVSKLQDLQNQKQA